MRARIVELGIGRMDQHGDKATEASQGEIEDKRKLEAHQQSQSTGRVQCSTTAHHYGTGSGGGVVGVRETQENGGEVQRGRVGKRATNMRKGKMKKLLERARSEKGREVEE